MAPGNDTLDEVVKAGAPGAIQLLEACLTKLESIIDAGDESRHTHFCDAVRASFSAGLKPLQDKGINVEQLKLSEVSVQSGKHAIPSWSTPPSEDNIAMSGHFTACVAVQCGAALATIARTLLVDPNPLAKQAYSVAVQVRRVVISALTVGTTFSDVYRQALTEVEKTPELLSLFRSDVGFVAAESSQAPESRLTKENTREVEAGMVLSISTSFHTQGAAPWAVWLSDTVVIGASGTAEAPTLGCRSRTSDVIFTTQDEEDEPAAPAPKAAAPAPAPVPKAKAASKAAPKEPAPAKAKAPSPKPKSQPVPKVSSKAAPKPATKPAAKPAATRAAPRPPAPRAAPAGGAGTSRLRASTEQAKLDLAEQAKLEERQKELRKLKLDELQARFCGGDTHEQRAGGSTKRLWEYQAYDSREEVPVSSLKKPRLHIDTRAEALLVPIGNVIVPFNVATIKNMSRSTVDKRQQFLRVNFFTPGQGKSADDFPVVSGRRIFIKELSFRCETESADNFDAVLRSFKLVQKSQKQRSIEGEVRDSKQGRPPLELLRTFPCLRDLNMRPTPPGVRRTLGTLEAHANGFRFRNKGSVEVDILYEQVAHVVFEPCVADSLVILIHLHLKEPIVTTVTRKTTDIQFFTEVGTLTEDLSTAKAGSMHDPDELLEEQRERDIKQKLNQAFLEFTKKLEAIPSCPLKVERPQQALAFTGVPLRGHVKLVPCKSVLVSLQEWPPFCISLADVDIVVFERARIGLREMDLTFVRKDFNQLPVRISTVPTSKLDAIKRWLASNEIVWYSCSMNMQWQMVMKEINTDRMKFVTDGGWDAWFADMVSGSEDSGEEDNDGDSDFPEDDADDDDDEQSEDDVEESDSGPGEDEDDEGEDWDELEKQAAQDDEKKRFRDRAKAPPLPPPKRGKRR